MKEACGSDRFGDFRKEFLKITQPTPLESISTYSSLIRESVWVTFISSSSRIADYSAPSIIPNNLRIPVGGTMLFTPYTLLGWDQGAPPFSDDPLKDTSNSTFERLVGFGRPLWHSYLNIGYEGLLELGKEKLLNAVSFKTNDVHHVLAVIGQRFGLRLRFGHRDSAACLEAGVSNHLLVCHSITEDRKWKITSYPSEPFLSHVSGFLLHEQERNVVDALTCIKKKVENGMIEIDEKGQFVSRIVWLL
ncbi:hypothetical protein A0H81_05680 [Grifola frondosa]|uniref:Uncharacterized protein n=1 Tax=Grifola frondosa TaxID=5627 RepID=A0A1C7MD97_GRIFR|nr:hypothetical protein A0H81_05680 [Grifola frondosa]